MRSRIREKIGRSVGYPTVRLVAIWRAGLRSAPERELAMTASDVEQVQAELDEDHRPETNGRMAVCRRCGVRTDSPAGTRHVLDERRLVRSRKWLALQEHDRRVRRLLEAYNN
jgi:hypothetical protein